MKIQVIVAVAVSTWLTWAPHLCAENDLTIVSGSNVNITAGPIFTTTNDNAFLQPITITNLWSASAVSITTGTGGANSQAGEISIQEAINTTTTFGLTIQATHNLAVTAGGIASNGTGSIDLTAGAGLSVGSDIVTVGGAVALTAHGVDGISLPGNIYTGNDDVSSLGAHGGDIHLTTTVGSVDTSGGTLSTSQSLDGSANGTGNGGGITIQASGDIRTSTLWTFSNGDGYGGAIQLTAGGSIQESGGFGEDAIDASTFGAGNAGAITLQANGTGAADGISIINGIYAASVGGNGGMVTLTASGKAGIKTGNIHTGSDGSVTDGLRGGEIKITALAGDVDTSAGTLSTSYGGAAQMATGNAGDVTIQAAGDIRTSIIWAFSNGDGSGGAVHLTAGGSIQQSVITNVGAVDASTFGIGDAGAVTLEANGTGTSAGISLADGIYAASSSGNGGAVTLTALGGAGISLTTGIYTGSNGSAVDGFHGGDITLTASAGSVNAQTATISTSTGLNRILGAANGGNITIVAAHDITVSELSAFSQSGTGGAISLTAGNSITQTGTGLPIDNSGPTGSGDLTFSAPTISLASVVTGMSAMKVLGQNVTLGDIQSDGTLLVQPQAGMTSTHLEITGKFSVAGGFTFNLGNGGTVQVDQDAELGGNGTIQGETTVLGTLAPSGQGTPSPSLLHAVKTNGTRTSLLSAPLSGSTSTLTFTGGLDVSQAQGFIFTLGDGASDQVIVSDGPFSIGTLGFDEFQFRATGDFEPGTFVLFESDQPVTGAIDFNNTSGLVFDGYNGTLSLAAGDREIMLTVTSTPAPEPSSVALLAAGFFLPLARRRRGR